MTQHVAVWLLYHTSILLYYVTNSILQILQMRSRNIRDFIRICYAWEICLIRIGRISARQSTNIASNRPTTADFEVLFPRIICWVDNHCHFDHWNILLLLEKIKTSSFFPLFVSILRRKWGVSTISRCTYFLLDIQHKKPTLARFWWTPKCCVKVYGRPLKISVPWKPWKIAPWTQRLW